MHEIINNQRKFKISPHDFSCFVENVLENIPQTFGKSVTISLVSDRKMRQLNKNFRGKNSTTDVLSFPFEAEEFEQAERNYLGDVVISLQQAERQAAENDLDIGTEIKQLILHGILHLCGFDHETDDGEMNRRELKLRESLKI